MDEPAQPSKKAPEVEKGDVRNWRQRLQKLKFWDTQMEPMPCQRAMRWAVEAQGDPRHESATYVWERALAYIGRCLCPERTEQERVRFLDTKFA